MLRFFAPLLLFAAKPEFALRLAIGALAAASLFVGVWLISNIAVTFDTLKNPYIAAAYAAVLFFFFAVVSLVAWLRLRRLTAPPQLASPQSQPQLQPLPADIVGQRARELSGRWDAELKRAARKGADRLVVQPAPAPQTPAALALALPAARATLTVTGPAHTGKTALIAVLAGTAPALAASDLVRLIDAGPSDGDERHVMALVANAKASDAVLFVVDQDLRAPEVAAIKRFIAARKPIYVVLNKSDQFTAADRDAILASIRAKLPRGFAAANVLSVTGAPVPVAREIEDARGAIRVEMRRPPIDIAALTGVLARIVPPRPGRTLRFEAAA
jgi:membrane protein implicated in regulation of membrane protease activity